MLGRAQSSKRRYAEYLAKRKDPEYARLEAAPDGTGEKPRPKRKRSFWALLRALWGHLRGRRRTVVFALSTLSLATLIGMSIPAGTKIAIDYILTDNPGPEGLPAWVPRPERREHLLLMLGAATMALTLLSIAVGMWGRWNMTRLRRQVQAAMQRRVFEHAVRLPLNKVYELKSGGATSLIRDDAGQSAELLFTLIYNPWRAVVQFLFTLVILALVDWRMLLGGLLLGPAVWISHKTWISRIRPIYRDIRALRQSTDAHATETFAGMRVVRGFHREHAEAARFTRAAHLWGRMEILVWWWSRIVDIAWSVLIPFASTCVLVYGGWMILRGALTLGDVMMFTTYLLMLLGPLETLTSTATGVQQNLAGFDRVLDLLEQPEEFARAGREASPGVALQRAAVRGHVELRQVTFKYPGMAPDAAPVIRGVSLDVRPGEMIALVGPSGCGKTTLSNLIARFYDPTSGAVLLDGRNLREIEVGSYRRLLGIVEQDVFLFDGTVAENIAYADRRATPDRIAAAARAANAAGFIEKLERGYDTVIGERGVRLSGGQKQRVAIARALLADPRILILDEATSNLDTESEHLIQRSLARLLRGRTSFVIAHRLSTIRHASRIVVLEEGRVIEVGSHEELLASGGRYAEYLRKQVEGWAPEPDGAAAPARPG